MPWLSLLIVSVVARVVAGDVQQAGRDQGPAHQRLADARRAGDAPDPGAPARRRRRRHRRLPHHLDRPRRLHGVGRRLPGAARRARRADRLVGEHGPRADGRRGGPDGGRRRRAERRRGDAARARRLGAARTAGGAAQETRAPGGWRHLSVPAEAYF